MKRLLFIFLLFLAGFASTSKGQDNTALVINTETGKKYQIKEGRRIIFLTDDYPVLTKAKVLQIKDEKLVVERRKNRRQMELDTKQLKTIGLKTGGTFISGGLLVMIRVFFLSLYNLNRAHHQYKRCDLTGEWKLVTVPANTSGLRGKK